MKRSTKVVLTSAGILATTVALSGCTDDFFDAINAKIMYGPTQVIASDLGTSAPVETTAAEATSSTEDTTIKYAKTIEMKE